MSDELQIIIMAAGLGTRMKSRTVKVLHRAAGRPLIDYVVDLAHEISDAAPVVVVGHQREAVQQHVGDRARYAVQEQQLGTGHAVQQAIDQIKAKEVLILSGDVPLTRAETLLRLIEEHRRSRNALTLLTMNLGDPGLYGRIVRDAKGAVERIVEAKDANEQQRAIREVNAGIYIFDAGHLVSNLKKLSTNNAQGEYYLTDLIGMLRDDGKRVGALLIEDPVEVLGVNSRSELATVEGEIQRRVVERLMSEGVTFRNPSTVVIDSTVSIGPDTVVYPFVTLEGTTRIGTGCVIEPGVHLQNVAVGNDVHLKTGTVAEDAVIDELSARASALHALVRSSAAEFHWVMLADQLSLLETRDGIGTLRAAGIRVAELIANRLTPPPDRRCGLCDARRAEEARVLSEVRQLGVPIATVADQGAEPRGLRALGRIAAQRSRSLGHLTKSGKPPRRSSLESHWGHEGAPSGAAIMSPTFSAPLGHLTKEIAPAGTRLLFFGGKGGVGKTTAAATAGLALAERGQRVLLLSTDPAHSLGDALRMEIGDEEREVAPRLRARELDAAQAFRARRDRYRAAVDQLFEALRGGSSFDAPYDRLVMQDLIELAPPGLDELFGLLAVIDALRREEVVVVDTAPTGHALRLLELVSTAREWVQVLLQILLKYRRVTGLGQLAKDLTDTARELREFEELLHDPLRARFVALTRAAALPRLETTRLLKALKRLRVAAPAVLVNALTPPGCSRCKRAGRDEARELTLLRKARRGWAMLGAPAVAPGPRGLDELREFGRTWTRIE